MGLRGPAPQPTKLRILNGNPSKRPLPENEPQYPSGCPLAPSNLSAGARKVWHSLVQEMAASGVLRRVDASALAQLCEDQAMLDELRDGWQKLKTELRAKAKEAGKTIAGNASVHIARSIEGRRAMLSIRELERAVLVRQREFGLTPASNSRVQMVPGNGQILDLCEQALCGPPDERVQ